MRWSVRRINKETLSFCLRDCFRLHLRPPCQARASPECHPSAVLIPYRGHLRVLLLRRASSGRFPADIVWRVWLSSGFLPNLWAYYTHSISELQVLKHKKYTDSGTVIYAYCSKRCLWSADRRFCGDFIGAAALFHRSDARSYNGSERERVSRTINHWEV